MESMQSQLSEQIQTLAKDLHQLEKKESTPEDFSNYRLEINQFYEQMHQIEEMFQMIQSPSEDLTAKYRQLQKQFIDFFNDTQIDHFTT